MKTLTNCLIKGNKFLLSNYKSNDLNLSEITSCKEYSSNLLDDRKVVKLIVVNVLIKFVV